MQKKSVPQSLLPFLPGVDLLAGMFSFADLPRNYKYILGVTGTLSELLKIPGFRKTLEEKVGQNGDTIGLDGNLKNTWRKTMISDTSLWLPQSLEKASWSSSMQSMCISAAMKRIGFRKLKALQRSTLIRGMLFWCSSRVLDGRSSHLGSKFEDQLYCICL